MKIKRMINIQGKDRKLSLEEVEAYEDQWIEESMRIYTKLNAKFKDRGSEENEQFNLLLDKLLSPFVYYLRERLIIESREKFQEKRVPATTPDGKLIP